MTHKLRLLAALIGITLFASCAKEGPTGPQGVAGPGYTGTISGHVNLYDKYGNRQLYNLDSTTITLDGVTTYTTATTTADVNGAYAFNNDAETGNYTLTALCPGYGATELINFNYLSGTLNKDIRMSAIPDSFITSFIAVHNSGSLYDSLVVNTLPDPLARNCIIFINTNAAVSSSEYTGYLSAVTHAIAANATVTTVLIPKSQLNGLNISDSAMVYYAAYSYVVNDMSVYEDPSYGKNVYNSVNANPIIDSAIAP